MNYSQSAVVVLFTFLFWACNQKSESPRLSGAGIALDNFSMKRSYPSGKIKMDNLTIAHDYKKTEVRFRDGELTTWSNLGPTNVGGRTISLAFHPDDPDIIFVGSASGGLWKSTSAGVGAEAWQLIQTGFPVLGVGAIAIDPNNPDRMFIGTGEMYNNNLSMPGIINRLTRGSYGIGILVSEDGGDTWSKSLDWSYGDMRGVQDIVFDPNNSDIIYAATSEGLYKSENGGSDWNNVLVVPMAVDIKINPLNSNIVFVTFGSLRHQQTGIYRTIDGGQNFEKLTNGLPLNYSGKTLLAFNPEDPNTIYADVANDLVAIGLYRSIDGGDSWSLINSQDIARWQGWFAHDIVVDPNNPLVIIRIGIAVHKSVNGGLTFTTQSNNNWFRDYEAGEQEGPPSHVHSDVHAVYAHPKEENTFFFVADGGIYVTENGGSSFESRNGGYVTTQLYPNFSNSSTDSLLAIGGLQDNSTIIYEGSKSWRRVLGGDGMCTGIDFENDNVLYASSQFLNMSRSINGGLSFSNITPFNVGPRNFNGPFEISLSNSNIIYAGTDRLRRSDNRGDQWSSNGTLIDGNTVLQMAINPSNPDHLILSTAPDPVTGVGVEANVYETTDAGQTFTIIEGLPDRLALDFAFNPEDPSIKYIVFSGFGTPHVYRTIGEDVWTAIDNGLPDLPTNSIFVDPLYPNHIYVANDLGVYVSLDDGESWQGIMDGLPDVVYGIHLSYSPSNRKIRLATHGNGVFEASLINPIITATNNEPLSGLKHKLYPNPVGDIAQMDLEISKSSEFKIEVYNSSGQFIKTILTPRSIKDKFTFSTDYSDLSSGVYYYQLINTKTGIKESKAFIKT